MTAPRVLLAPDKFKGSVSAAAVAGHLAVGLRRAAPGVVLDEMPVADGGEGTVDAALAAGFAAVTMRAAGPLGEPRDTRYAVRGSTAVVEMAAVSGLEMLRPDDRTARSATSRGLGEVLLHAIDGGARTLVIGVGGSASTDGGAGMLAALGVRLTGPSGQLADGGDALRGLAEVDVSGLDRRLGGVEVVLASDVDNPLLGSAGAAAVYGPQKGADPHAVADLEEGLCRWVDALEQAAVPDARGLADAPGAGAAGGVGYAAMALLGARRRPGADVVLELAGFDERIRGVDLVVTGEGSLDTQSLHGKAPVGVATAAGRARVPVVGVCGRNQLSDADVHAAGLSRVYALTDLEPDVARCIADPGPLLERLGERIAVDHLGGPAGIHRSTDPAAPQERLA